MHKLSNSFTSANSLLNPIEYIGLSPILLTHGYFLEEDEKEKKIMKPYPTLGLLYISAYLEQHNIEHEVFDSTFSNFNLFTNYLLQHKPAIIGIYTNLMTKLNVLKIIDFVKNNSTLHQTKIILGGPEVRHHAENFLRYGAHYIVLGEGEDTMLELIQALHQNHNTTAIAGLAYLHQNQFVKNAERPFKKNLDELPQPNRKKINLQLYFNAWKNAHGQSSITMSTMRGCPYSCKWCSRAVYGSSYRRRSAALVVAEMVALKQQYNFDTIWFVDDVFTIHHGWLREFNAEIQKQNCKIPYEIITRADRMNEEVTDLLKSSGCYRVWIGAESGSQTIIDAMDRRVDVQQVRQMIQLANKKGLQTGTFIMLGYPGETKKDIKETIIHLQESNPHYYTVTIAYPIKGTPLYTEVEPAFLQNLPWHSSTDRMIDFKRTYPKKYYHYALRWVSNEVQHHKLKLKNSMHIKLPWLKLKAMLAKGLMSLNAK
jgi:anaerobic magnesium-protoporphyrin IX monomethyl ester cyclase